MSTASAFVEQIDSRSDEGLYETIDGREVEVPPMSALAGRLANRLAYFLNCHAIPRGLGEANVENLFHLAQPVERNRRPDVAFVSRERWPSDKPLPDAQNAWDVVPNLAVETVSPSDLSQDLLDRIDEYFRAGVELVWVIYPKQKQIYVYEALTNIRVLTGQDVLDGGKVLPSFTLPLRELFIA